MATQTANSKQKISSNLSKHLFWIFERYSQAAQVDKLDDEITLLFLANISLQSFTKTQKKVAIEDLVQQFLQKENVAILIKSLFKIDKIDNSLTYAIILKEDNHDYRKSIFEFLHFYEELEIAKFIPIRFRFIPVEVEQEFIATEKLIQIL